MAELEKEAEKYAKKKYGLEGSWGMNIQESACMDGYMAGAEPREKRIADLEWQFKEVVKDNDYYQAENQRLEKENVKAKEIIKGILPYTTFTFDEETDCYLKKYYKEAEDFIKE